MKLVVPKTTTKQWQQRPPSMTKKKTVTTDTSRQWDCQNNNNKTKTTTTNLYNQNKDGNGNNATVRGPKQWQQNKDNNNQPLQLTWRRCCNARKSSLVVQRPNRLPLLDGGGHHLFSARSIRPIWGSVAVRAVGLNWGDASSAALFVKGDAC